jgi:hypothetical protein
MALEVQNNPFPSVLMVEGDPEALPDADPASGQRRLAVGTDHLLYLVDNSGVKHAVAGSSGLSDPMTTRGDVIVRNASNVTARLPIGSSGKVLSSDGTDVSWQTPTAPPAGGLVLLEQHAAAASATLDFTAFISSAYDEYMIDLLGIIPASSSTALWLRMGTGGGPTYDTGANYGWSAYITRAGAATFSGAESGATKIQVGFTTDFPTTATKGLSGSLRLVDPQSTARHKQMFGQVTNFDGSSFNVLSMCNGIYISTTAVTAIRFLFSSGNIASGTIRIYGVAK